MPQHAEPVVILALNWLVPGLGFVLKGRPRQGIILFLLLNATFVIGLLLHGAVVFPSLGSSAGGINWVNVLTFIGQLGNGGMTLFCFLQESWGLRLFDDQPWHAWADLAALYFFVSGTLNYFATCNLWDRCYKTAARGRGAAT